MFDCGVGGLDELGAPFSLIESASPQFISITPAQQYHPFMLQESFDRFEGRRKE